MMKKRKQGKDLLFLAVILILVLVMLYSGLQLLEPTVSRNEQQGEAFVSKVIERGGVEYFPRQDITTVLVMGIDQFGPVEESSAYINTGAADMNIVLIFDEKNEVINIIHLNRDTMVEMPVLGIGGKQAGTYYGQLALSHTFGRGLTDSCENTRRTVSDLFYGVAIDYYVSMNMDAIAILNDAVGGVTVDVTEDFSKVDASIVMGKVKLTGDQAIHYVRTRQGVGDQLNVSRIQRHKAYLDGFMEAFRAQRETDPKLMVSAYEAVQPYIVTDCSVNAISGMMDRYSDYRINEIISPAGNNVRGEEYYEFYLDEEDLDELILRIFYAPKG